MTRNRLTWIIASVGICAIILYAAYQARYVIGGPSLVIEDPQDGEVFLKPLITISGHAKNITRLSLNGRTVFTDENGNFSAALPIPAGHTIIEIRAEDRFGRVRIERREVVMIRGEIIMPAETLASTTAEVPNKKEETH